MEKSGDFAELSGNHNVSMTMTPREKDELGLKVKVSPEPAFGTGAMHL